MLPFARRIAFCLLAFCVPTPSTARVWTVVLDGSGDAPTVQAAIDSSAAGDEIVVGPGRYTWTNQGGGDVDRGMIVFLREKSGMIFRSSHGPGQTILDAEYRSRTIYLQGMNGNTIEGFTVTGGQSTAYGDHFGGGFFTHISSDVVRDCVFRGNRAAIGAGLVCAGGGSSIRIEDCLFEMNEASSYGGGVAITGSSPVSQVTRCVFRDNVSARFGGGLAVVYDPVDLRDCVFLRNEAGERGGGYFGTGNPGGTVDRCTAVANHAPEGSGIYIGSSTMTVTSTIAAFNFGNGFDTDGAPGIAAGCLDIFGNAGGDFLPAGVADLGYTIFLDPLFCDRAAGDLTLRENSPCLPIFHPETLACGRIGALPAACGAVPVAERSWGAVKLLRR